MALGSLLSISDNLFNQAARLSRAVYESEPGGAFAQAPGWTPVSAADMPVSPGLLNDGLFSNENGKALVAASLLDGKRTLAIAFRGSDQREDWLQNLRTIDEHAANFTGLLSAADALAAQGTFDQVLLTGHSLGGASTQLSMDDLPHAPQLIGVTFGSPGSSTGGIDDRLVNFRIANDPIPWLAENRAEIGAFMRALPSPVQSLVAQQAAELIQEDPPVTKDDVLASLPFMTTDYELRGNLVQLPSSGGMPLPTSLSLDLADKIDLSRHGISLYQSFMPARTAGTDASGSFDGSGAMDDHFGRGGNDTLRGLGADDFLFGNSGDDQLFGNQGDDLLYGGQARDTLFGGQGNDVGYGNLGDDELWGNLGDDTLFGGTGADRFCFGQGIGHDKIVDFSSAGGDHILLARSITWTLSKTVEGDAVIVFSPEDSITLIGVRWDQFTADWLVTA
jgi:hypothetical protein